MDRVRLNKPDLTFIKEVEEKSGQAMAKCYQCGNCTAGCPMSFTFDIPVSKIMRFIQTGQKETVLSSKAIWMCATCETCSERCPNEIEVATVMDVCRHMARRADKCAVRSAKSFGNSFMQSIMWNGRLHEVGTMAGFMLRTGRLITDVDLAPKVLPKGKMSIFPHRTAGKSEVQAILKRFNEGALARVDDAEKKSADQREGAE